MTFIYLWKGQQSHFLKFFVTKSWTDVSIKPEFLTFLILNPDIYEHILKLDSWALGLLLPTLTICPRLALQVTFRRILYINRLSGPLKSTL